MVTGSRKRSLRVIPSPPLCLPLNAPDSAVAGQTVTVDWQGPNYDLDYLSVANPGDRGSRWRCPIRPAPMNCAT